MGTETDQSWLVGHRLRSVQRGFKRIEVVRGFAKLVDVPSIRPEPQRGVVAVCEFGRTVDRDVVVVVDHDQSAEAKMACEGGRLVAEALHETAVTNDAEGVVVTNLGAEPSPQVRFSHRHANGVSESLRQRPRGDLDARGMATLGVARGNRPPLAESFEVFETKPVAREVQQRILQDRRVTVGENETITIEPLGLLRRILHHTSPQNMSQGSKRHRRARVAGIGRLDRIHGQPANGVDSAEFQFW